VIRIYSGYLWTKGYCETLLPAHGVFGVNVVHATRSSPHLFAIVSSRACFTSQQHSPNECDLDVNPNSKMPAILKHARTWPVISQCDSKSAHGNCTLLYLLGRVICFISIIISYISSPVVSNCQSIGDNDAFLGCTRRLMQRDHISAAPCHPRVCCTGSTFFCESCAICPSSVAR